MKILISGSGGYLGGRLNAFLTAHNHEITILKRRDNSDQPTDSKIQNHRVSFQNEDDLKDACNGLDAIIHAAGMNATDCSNNPLDANQFNGYFSGKLAEAASRAGVEKFIYLSTFHVYSQNPTGRLNEQSPLQNAHPYAKSKALGEQQVLKFCRSSGTQPYIVRLSNCFGRPVAVTANCWHLLVPNLCAELALKQTLTLKSNPIVERNFLTISDLCYGLEYLLKNDVQSDTLNFGGSKNFTLMELAELIQKRSYDLFQTSPRIVLKSLTEEGFGSPPFVESRFLFDCSRAERLGIKFRNRYTQELDDLLFFCFKNRDKLSHLAKPNG